MNKKELELENKILRDEVRFLRDLVSKLGQPNKIVVNPPVDITPQVGWSSFPAHDSGFQITA